MEATANNNSHGYDQRYRWGEKGDYDCSAAVITAWQNAGVPVKGNGATYTGNMLAAFLKSGFRDVTSLVNRATGAGMDRGDVLLNSTHHTAMYCGNGKLVQASINEKGTAVGGTPGDQTGREFNIRSYYNYPWNYVLRYVEAESVTVEQAAKNVIAGRYGNGDARKKAIEALGLNYNTVQARVNAILASGTTTKKSVDEVAKEVISGKWGNGDTRRARLTEAGYDYNAVQAKVNEWLSASKGTIAKGDTVRVTNAVTYNGQNFKCWYDTYTVMQVTGDRAVIGVNGVITAAVNVKNLSKL
jgi:molybdopterin converting factor small subunit